MKFNREKIAAGLALLLLVWGFYGVVGGFVAPARGIKVPDPRLKRSSREIVARRYRTFTEDVETSRNPFSFSEGWQRMETTPMARPVLPFVPRLVPHLGPGPTALEGGFLWQDRPPVEVGEKEGDS